MRRRMASESVRTGFQTMVRGTSSEPLRSATTCWDCSATCARVSGPYRCWLPVANQISKAPRSGTTLRLVMWSLLLGGLSVDVLVAVEQRVDRILRDRDEVARLPGDVDRARDVLAHHGGL